MRTSIKYILTGICGTMFFLSCKKNNLVVDKDITAPAVAKFNTIQSGDSVATYYVRSTNEVYKLPVGVSNVTNTDRTIQFTYTGKAVQGTQYSAPASIIIKAGEALDSLPISGIFAGYPGTDRVDTLRIAISGGDVPAGPYKSVYYLILRKACDVNLPDFYGSYDNTIDNLGASDEYGPYSAGVVDGSFLSTGPTSGTLRLSNVADWGGNDITVMLDWSDPNPTNFKLTVPDQKFDTGKGWWIKNSSVTGTFVSCDLTLTLNYDIYVKATGVNKYSNQVTVFAK